MSNFVLLDFSDTSYTYLPKALKELMKGEKSELYRLAREQGVFDVDMVTKELRNTSGAMGQAFNKITAADEPSQFYGYSTDMFKHFKKAKDLSLTKLENLYQQEDQVFRMAVFMDRMDKKMNVTEAAMNARKWFIDYDINAPAINALRRTATPFLSYTYRIVPLLAETATLRPHKFAKWAGIGYGLNEVGKQVAGGDPDLERVTMRDEYSKTLWGVPYMPPTVLRVPWNSNDGDSQYLDVSRWIPGGDIFEERETGVPGVPAPLQPSFGLYGDIYNVAVARTDPFTGQEIDGLGVDEDGKAIAKALVKRLTPNLPIIPGSYSYDKIARSLREGKGYEKGELVPGSGYTAPYSFGESVAYSLGVKLRPQDPDVNQKSKEFQLNQDLKAADQIAREARKDFENGDITYKEREELIKKAELRRVQVLAEWEAYTKVYNEARAKRIQRIEKERLNKFKGGEVDVPYTKDEPEDRVDSFTGKPYSDQMARLGLAEGGKPSLAELVLNAIQKDPKRNYSDEEISVLKRHADYVANAESDNIANRIQMGGGPGRGKYQYELSTENKSGQQGAKTAVNRYINFKKDKKLTLTEEDKQLMQDKNPDFSKLSEDMQDAIFYADKAMGKMPVTDLVKGNLSQEDAWADYHWAGNPEERQTKIDYFIGKNYMPEEITRGKLEASPDYQ